MHFLIYMVAWVARLSSGKMGPSSPMAPYSATMRPFSRKDRAVAHVARVHTETKIYSRGGACGNTKWYVVQWSLSRAACSLFGTDVLLITFSSASFASKDNLHAHMYTPCSFWCVAPSSSYFSLNYLLVSFRSLKKPSKAYRMLPGHNR